MRRSRWAWLAPTLVLVLAGTIVWSSRKHAAVDEGSTAGSGPAGEVLQGGVTAAPHDAAAMLAPLATSRPARVPSRPGSINELAAKAGTGDAIAACQLAAEITDCRTSQYLHGLGPAFSEQAPSARCDDLLARYGGRHLEWLRQAAHAGEPEAMLRYAMGEGFGINGAGFDFLRTPGFDTWRREAPGMMQALIEAGYPEAVIYRMVASQPAFGGPLANLMPPDPLQDQAYNELFLLLNEESPLIDLLRSNLRSGANETLGHQARRQAERWHQDYFGGRTFDFEALSAEGENQFPVMWAHGATCSVPVGETAP